MKNNSQNQENHVNFDFNQLNMFMKELSSFMNNGFFHSMSQFSNPTLQEHNTQQIPYLSNLNLNKVNQMLDQVNKMVNVDLMKVLNQNSDNQSTFQKSEMEESNSRIPIQMWEKDEQILILASFPGLKNKKNIKVKLKDAQHLQISADLTSLQMTGEGKMIKSEIPVERVNRIIKLPSPVSVKSYSSNFQDGLLKVTLYKNIEDYDFDFEE